jgi:uncharacterized protein with HEPN domain
MTDDTMYLIHIQECLTRIKSYTKKGKDEFFDSNLIQDAVVRNLQTLSESTQRLSDDLRKQVKDVNWRDIAGFRNLLVHNYLGLDYAKIWQIVENDVPALRASLAPWFAQLPKKSERKKPDRKKKH